MIAEVHELFAQRRDVDTRRHVEHHVDREHRRPGVRGAVGARRDVADVDAARGEEPRERLQHARLVEADDVHGVRDDIRARRPLLGRRMTMVRPDDSPSFCSSPSSLARVCQLPATSSSIANSLPSAVMRLSRTLPPQSTTTRVRSKTRPVRSLPMAQIAISCFMGRRTEFSGAASADTAIAPCFAGSTLQ